MLHGSPQFLKFEEAMFERETFLRKNVIPSFFLEGIWMNVISKNFNMSPSPQVLDHIGGYLNGFESLEHMLDNFHIYKISVRHTFC